MIPISPRAGELTSAVALGFLLPAVNSSLVNTCVVLYTPFLGNGINLTFSVLRGGYPGICGVSDGKAREGLGLLRYSWFLRCKEFCADLELLEFLSWVKGVDCEKEEKKTQEAQLRSEEPKTLSTCRGKGHESLEG